MATASCTAFEGHRRVETGGVAQVAAKVKSIVDRGGRSPVLIFDDATGELVEIDFRGTRKDVLERLKTPTAPEASAATAEGAQRGPRRPRLGVVAREVTLLPRHWQWLNAQPGGASVALRRLVEEARRANAGKDRVRTAQEVTYRFMSALAGNLPGFEEATRALFASDADGFDKRIKAWPRDVRDHVRKLAMAAFEQAEIASDVK